MKILNDGTQVPPRTYYYLLDFNEATARDFITQEFGKRRLCDLNIEEYRKLFEHATTVDRSKF